MITQSMTRSKPNAVVSRRAEFLAGARDTFPLIVGAIPFGIIFGTLAAGSGVSFAGAAAMSAFVFAGSAQFIAAGLVAAGTSWPFIVLTTFVVNLRHALYSATLAPQAKHLSAGWQIPLAFWLTDETFVIAANRYNQNDVSPYKHWYWLGSAVFMYTNWQVCTWLGLTVGQLIPDAAAWGLDFAMPVTFLGMVVPYLKNRPMVAAVVVSGVVSVLAYPMPNKLGLIVAAIAGIVAGIVAEKMRRGRENTKNSFASSRQSRRPPMGESSPLYLAGGSMDKRVKFDFEIDFTNGGGIQGQDFRLDIAGDDISDRALADYLIDDLRLLMVGEVRILNKEILTEKHKRQPVNESAGPANLVDLSHVIEHGLVTYKGLPAPIICDYLSREKSREIYEAGTEFQIGKIEMVANTGTYLDCPFHRYEHGKDLAEVGLDKLADLEGLVIRADYRQGLAIGPEFFQNKEIRNRAVLVHTGWAEHWNTERYFENHPYLTAQAAEYLQKCGVKLVGIDSLNIDNTQGSKSRPVHSTLLGAEILIVEHLCNLEQVPDEGFTFSALPPKFKGVGTFPVRALAKVRV